MHWKSSFTIAIFLKITGKWTIHAFVHCDGSAGESCRLNLRVAPEPWGPVSHARVLEFSESGHPGRATSLQLMLAAGPTEDEARAATSQQQQLCPQLLPPRASQQPVHWLLGFGWGLGAQGFAELTQCPWLERGRAGLTPRWVSLSLSLPPQDALWSPSHSHILLDLRCH